ncbi:MAG TPA: branched-chain-amino-acid transaminase [Chthoniobacteraceae bacterium]|jgi:branched-chain amino acid aminotransferase|nr:branched-chain-amino-acid transaminase [Chthoniobacteraceae bacterium]
MELKIYLDGALVPESQAKVSVFDHGLLYGDGVFEGIRFYNGRVFRLEQHIRRLYDCARALLLNIPLTPEEMIRATCETIRANNLRDGYIRLVITRGVGPMGLSPFKCPKSSIIIIAASIALYPEDAYRTGLTMATVATRRPSHDMLSPQVKSLNYLNNVMAKVEAIQAGAEEGLMLNDSGLVAECTGDNLFIVRDGIISTPPLTAGALDGITRGVVFEIARELGLPMRERDLSRHDIYTADECFLTGTAAEVIAAVRLDQRAIGTGKPGDITNRIIARFRELTQTTGTPIYA